MSSLPADVCQTLLDSNQLIKENQFCVSFLNNKMPGRIRSIISEQISQFVKQNNVCWRLEVPARKSEIGASLQIALNEKDDGDLLRAIPKIRFNSTVVQDVRIHPSAGRSPTKCEFLLQPQAFLEDVLQRPVSSPQHQAKPQSQIVMEFSSPNIAKPFHVGHLRSTIIGNVLGNLYRHLDHQVTNLNYLGDWGTQFGLLQVGVEMTGLTDEKISSQPIECLHRAYVAANAAAITDPGIAVRARRYFTELENGSNPDMTEQWQKYRQYTIAELERVYARLGVNFDQYDWESQYSQANIVDVLHQLTKKSLISDEEDGRKVVHVDGRRVPIIKSDGSTLYLARDIAALLDRLQRFNFDRILYVVDNAQTDHFNACFKTTTALCEQLPPEKMLHVKFGRIRGMSTRSGNAVFLRDLLDEARDVMLEKQLQSSTTKVPLLGDDNKEVADVLGVSAVIVNDLKQRRQRDYDFDWNKALQMNGDTGIKLQYTHCRLSNMLEKTGGIETADVLPSMEHLIEPEAQDLLMEIARFEQTVWKSTDLLEACGLVNYLFALCNSTSRAIKRLNVKHETCLSKQQNRILLFKAAKETLSKGMQILGLKPLTKM